MPERRQRRALAVGVLVVPDSEQLRIPVSRVQVVEQLLRVDEIDTRTGVREVEEQRPQRAGAVARLDAPGHLEVAARESRVRILVDLRRLPDHVQSLALDTID